MSTILALDSSNRWQGRVTIAVDGEIASSISHDSIAGPAEALLGLFDVALASAGLDMDRLDGVAVVSGPGSFTGLRIGVMTAKSLAWARGLPLLSAGGLTTLAGSCFDRGVPLPIACAVEAGGGHVYLAHFQEGADPITLHADARRIDTQMLPGELVGARTVAVDTEQLLETLGDPSGSSSKDVGGWTADPVHPLADRLAVGASQARPWCPLVDPTALIPLYLGPSQAERTHGVDLADQVHRVRRPRSEAPE